MSMKTGVANLPLHPGKAPRWLFERMTKLARGITQVIVYEYGQEELLHRLSDPFWFQALSCTLGFDWHSSGTTTVTCGALKEILPFEGMAMAGGKGRASRKALEEIEKAGDIFGIPSSKIEELKYSSRMAAKVDNVALQDGHRLYHHIILFTERGKWMVIQQGMNVETKEARRYHWLSDNVKKFVEEPHEAILGIRKERVLDMTSKESEANQKTSLDLVKDNPRHLRNNWASLLKDPSQLSLDKWIGFEKNKKYKNKINKRKILEMPRYINWDLMSKLYDFQPTNYEEMLSMRGVGPSTVRALSLISELIYGDSPSWTDPVKYSFAVGGKDGVPFPVDRKAMDESIDILKNGIEEAKVGKKEKMDAIKRLREFVP